jgi:hypothetical protein
MSTATLRLIVIAGALLAVPALAAPGDPQTRCGWLDNPTPGNFDLLDSAGWWVVAAQGGYQAEGLDDVPDLSGPEFVKTNGNYGYACVCMTVTTDNEKKRVTSIKKVTQKRIRDCAGDPKLPKMPSRN